MKEVFRVNEEKIARINELYHKAKEVGLTEAEKAEQKALRKQYIMAIRKNLRATLNNVSVENEDGTITDLGEKYGKKHEKAN